MALSVKGVKAIELLNKFPTASTLTLARILYKQFPQVYLDVEDARVSLRRHRGEFGENHRKHSKHLRTIEKTKYDVVLPESWSKKKEYFKIPIHYKKVGLIADVQCPYHDTEALQSTVKYLKEQNIDCLLMNGDIVDFYGLSSFEKDPTRRDFAQERIVAIDLLTWIKEQFKDIPVYYNLDANHECFDKDTLVLTNEGWKSYTDINMDTIFATYSKEKDCIEYQKPIDIIKYNYEGELNRIKSRNVDLLITDNHRLYLKRGIPSNKYGSFDTIEFSKCLNSSRVTFVASSSENNEENLEYSDDEIRLCAWILSDGSISTHNNYTRYFIYQSEKKLNIVTCILDRLNIKYSISERKPPTEICGKILKSVQRQFAISILSESYGICKRLVTDKNVLPLFLNKISDRQFDIFINSFIDADGSRHKSAPETSLMIYKSKDILEQLQTICFKHGYRTSISFYGGKHYRLNLTKNKYTQFCNFKEHISRESYFGDVWCVTVPNDTVIVKRNDKISITGNCRYEKLMQKKAPELLGTEMFMVEDLLSLHDIGIIPLRGYDHIRIGKLPIVHGHTIFRGITSPVSPARTVFMKMKHTCVASHCHKVSQYTWVDMKGETNCTWTTGCLMNLNVEYNPHGNDYVHGFAIVSVDKNGNFVFENKMIVNGNVV